MEITRYVALDLHKLYVVVGAVNEQKQIVLSPRRLSYPEFQEWAVTALTQNDAVVLEASSNAWDVYDQIEPLVGSVTVAHAQLVKLIASARVKTDARDTLHLARLLAAQLIPAVWVPPLHVRELRGLITHRRRLVQQRTQIRNRLHAVLARHRIPPPLGKVFAVHQHEWWNGLAISRSEQLRVEHDLRLHEELEAVIGEVEKEVQQMSTLDPWQHSMTFLIQLPGVGVLTAMTILSAIGTIDRFPSAKHLVGYAGLGASVHSSGQTQRGGRITKEGRRELRGVLVEVAWIACEKHPYWKAQFARLSSHIGAQKAIVAIARKLLVTVWHVLTKRQVDCHAEPPAVARKLMTWITRAGRSTPGKNRSRLQRLAEQLQRLRLPIDQITYGGVTYSLPATDSG